MNFSIIIVKYNLIVLKKSLNINGYFIFSNIKLAKLVLYFLNIIITDWNDCKKEGLLLRRFKNVMPPGA